MKKKQTLAISVLLVLFAMSVLTQIDGYAQGLQPNTTTKWHVKAAPSNVFDMYWTGGGGWIAENDSLMIFTINSLNDDIEGSLTLGNLTVTANNTEIAKDLTLGVWGATEWHPGLYVKVGQSNIDNLNETAYAAAERVQYNYLNGTMTSYYDNITIDGITMECIVFDYEQDSSGFGEPQITHLAYDMETGVLVEARTSYSFGEPYLLELELDLASSVDLQLVAIGSIVSIIIVIAVGVVLKRR
jgi:hypothetical protein